MAEKMAEMRELAAVPLLSALSDESRAKLVENAILHGVAAGTVLFEQGQMPKFQHIIVSGSVHLFARSVEGREVLIEVVEAPDLVIPAAVVTGSPYLMQARVSEPSRFLLVQAATFRSAVARDPVLAREVIGSLAGQFRRMVRQIKNLKLRSSTQRVGCYILALSKRQGNPTQVVLPHEKNLIASELGITRESFSRALASLQRFGIAVHGETISILDRERLAKESMPDPLIDGPESRPTMSKLLVA